jgi:cyclic pyranopterin phosphate synthase
MVDVSGKPETERYAKASGRISMSGATLAAICDNTVAKGDVISVARLAGIMAAKRTPELIPLCHQINLSDVQVTVQPDETLPGIRAVAEVRSTGRTGVEMEAITAVSVTLITVYDMAKAIDRAMVISDIALEEKRGGRSGHWRRA